jgi:hypothetical protein
VASKRKAIPIEVLRQKYDEYLRASAEQSPMIQVIVSAALTEEALVTLLSNFFVEGTTSENILKGALSGFSQCTETAYCLGLISDGMLDNLKLVGKIRNLFAHTPEFLDFDNPEVKSLCSQLTANKGWILPMSGGEGVPVETALKSKSSRQRFTSLCSALCMTLIRKAAQVERRKTIKDGWPKKNS